MDIKEIADHLGLSQDAFLLYQAGLELGETTVLELSRKTHLHRATIYDLLHDLETKGLFLKSVKGKRSSFIAAHPRILLELAKERVMRVDAFIPFLLSSMNGGIKKPKVQFVEGIEGIKSIYLEAAHASQKALYAFVGIDRLTVRSKVLLHFWEGKFLQTRLKNGVKGYLILPESRAAQEYKDQDEKALRESRLVPAATYNFSGEVLLFDKKIAFISYSADEEFALVLESEALSDTLRKIWRLAWSASY